MVDFHWSDHIGEIARWVSARRGAESVAAVEVPINPRGWYLRLPAR
jgi:hypothetical protein